MGYLQIVFGLTVFTTYQELPILQDDRDEGTSFKRISISGVCPRTGTAAEKTPPRPET